MIDTYVFFIINNYHKYHQLFTRGDIREDIKAILRTHNALWAVKTT